MNRLMALCTILLSMTVNVVSAQTITASITGSVVDPSGAIIAGARVVATNAGTNVAFETAANGEGLYTFPFLPIGNYKLAVETKGFKKSVVGPFKLETNQIARINVTLEVGDAAQTVEVTDVAPILQTESTSTGDSLSSSKLTSLPLNNRNFVSLTLLLPGAVSPNPQGLNSRFGARPYVNGNREQTNNFLLDGVDINDSIDNRVGYSPNVDALEEVKVVTGNAAAEFGNSGGATVLLQIKSGTNQFHGNVFNFLRNDKLDANGFFRNRNVSTATRTGFKRNIFGGTLGGPIVKNKLFFFVDYEGTLQRADGPASASVAPQTWRNGDLSSFPNTIVDPNNGQPFPGKQIPASRFSPVARALFANPSLYPLPNQAGVGPQSVTGNYAGASASKIDQHQADAKIDYRLSSKDNLVGRYSIGRYESIGSAAALPVFLTSGQAGPSTSGVVNWNRTISPTIVNEARVAFSRVVIQDLTLDWSGLLGADGNQRLGISGGQPIPGLSAVTLGGGLSGIGSPATLSNTADNKFLYYNNLTWQKGKHLLKFGVQFTRYQQNRYYAGNNGALGLFRYNGTYTGLDYADFLIDALNGKGRGAATGTWGHRSWRSALFFQDDYKVARNLTINLGLRWEYIQPIYEVADRQVNINTFTGQIIKPGGDFGRATYRGYPYQYMPRVGFAWTPDLFKQKLVLRAGYAYQTFLEGTGANLRLPLNPPSFVETDFTYDPRTPGSIRTGFSDVSAANITLDMPRPAGVTTPQLQARAWDLNLRPQATSQYNVTLEYLLDKASSISVAYVGQKGTHLVAPVEANQPVPGTGLFSTWSDQNLRRPLAQALPNVSNIARTSAEATMDYHSLQVTGRRRFAAGLEFLAAYTMGKTLTDNLGYYGSAFTTGEGAYWQNAYDRRANRGPAFFDIRHNFTIGGSFAPPVGKGQKFFSSMNKASDLVFGGWSLNYNLAARTGLPVTVRALDRTGQAVRGNVRANFYRPLQGDDSLKSVDNWYGLPVPATSDARRNFFCPAVGTGPLNINRVAVDNGQCPYGQSSDGAFGNGGIGTLRGPGFFNLDFSVGKKFFINERNYIDFRVELFNSLNTVSFAPPGASIGTPDTFGAIGAQVQNPRNIQFGLKYHF